MSMYKRVRGKLVLFCDTADEITIDPASREMISLPAEKLADLVGELASQKNPKLNWDNDAVVRYFAKLVQPDAQRLCESVTHADCKAATLDVLNAGDAITTKATQTKIVKLAASIAERRCANKAKQRSLTTERKKKAQAETRAIEERKALYESYGMRVPSRKNLIAELDRPFVPSKAALKRRRLAELKKRYGKKPASEA